jgi:hypothetical protein
MKSSLTLLKVAEWTEVEFSQLAMHQALRGMENEGSVTYARQDLKESWNVPNRAI